MLGTGCTLIAAELVSVFTKDGSVIGVGTRHLKSICWTIVIKLLLPQLFGDLRDLWLRMYEKASEFLRDLRPILGRSGLKDPGKQTIGQPIEKATEILQARLTNAKFVMFDKRGFTGNPIAIPLEALQIESTRNSSTSLPLAQSPTSPTVNISEEAHMRFDPTTTSIAVFLSSSSSPRIYFRRGYFPCLGDLRDY